MNFRKSNQQPKSSHDLEFLQESIANLPKREPRPGLKQELLLRILAEARREEPVAKKRRRSFSVRSLKFAVALAGAALAVLLVWNLLPPSSNDRLVAEERETLSGFNASQQLAQEIALKKGDSSDRLLRQTIPHQNGQFIGEGVEILVNDKQEMLIRKGASQSEIESNYDLHRLVQEIYTGGGQIVSLNGILVKPYTEIITRGALTEVSERRIQSPFNIKVIGDSEKLYKTLNQDSSVLMTFKNEKAIDVNLEKSHLVTITMNN
ncbi:DUF881 domain-containing protein [Tumebacillus flagellatus]|uniref:DUF881 domain-containing protein n=1 Tax=Tumebacillus flagellatus TaxID=1157490 RepID=A0A074LSN7_9BACL|nr:DUF881 domain-containing protein [Tumebacillus flagellatus]KEO85141.1 hypothetical protein EL26_00860 [Tumebacillus flagellatus]